MVIRTIKMEDIDRCTSLLIDAYLQEPWNERQNYDEVRTFLSRFTCSNIYIGWVVLENNNIIGFTVGIIIPSIDGDYFKLEEICISPDMQSKGIGTKLIKKITSELKNEGIGCIMLNTVKDFPAYRFYLNNGFINLNSSATMILED